MTRDYYGTKRVTAWPQQGKDPGSGTYELGPDGYAVKYADGYISWSPKEVFEAAYQPLDALSFGHAIQAITEGHKVARAGWNGKGMFLVLMNHGWTGFSDAKFQGFFPSLPFIAMKTADDKMVPWLASQTDMLANDWQIMEE